MKIKLQMFLNIYFFLFSFTLVCGVLSPEFIRPLHLLNLIRQASPLGIVALGETMVLISGGFDLSVGSIMILMNILLGHISISNVPILPQVFLLLVIGSSIGLINGLFITKLRINPFIMTLAMMVIIKGFYLTYVGGSPKGYIPEVIRGIAIRRIGGVFPLAVIIWIMISGAIIILLRRTVYGRNLYAVGGNKRCAYLSGIKVDLIIILTYVFSGLTAAIGGILASGNIGACDIAFGEPYMINAITVSVLGGTQIGGGRGNIIGTIAGTLLLFVMFSILIILGVGHVGKLIAEGLILIGALILYIKRG